MNLDTYTCDPCNVDDYDCDNCVGTADNCTSCIDDDLFFSLTEGLNECIDSI